MTRFVAALTALALAPSVARAQSPAAAAPLTVHRIYATREFASAPMPSAQWMRDGRSYLAFRPGATGGGADLVRVDVATGATSVVVPAALFVDEHGNRIEVEDLAFSGDESKLLVFHNSVRVWRQNTRGVYHVIDLRTRRVTPLSTRPGLQMFAKFSPDGRRVAFVRDNDLWMTDLATGNEARLTSDGSETIINGTTDWAYEEELDLRDAFRWSPDGRAIAFWRFDQSDVPTYPLLDPLPLYPTIARLHYPKAGEPNSRVRLGVVHLDAENAVSWLDVGGDPRQQYLPRMEWMGSDSLVVQVMPRSQRSVEVSMFSAASGKGRLMFVDADSAYVDVQEDPLRWIRGGSEFLWLSDRSGWRQLWAARRDGRGVRQLTTDGMDVLAILAVDEVHGAAYVIAAAPTPVERNVYRVPLAGGAMTRVTTAHGTHTLSIAPGARWAIDFASDLATPVTATAYELPAFAPRRVIQDNSELRRRVAALSVRAPELIEVPMPDGTLLDGYRIAPAGFDSTRKYPVLMYVYGGPAAPTVSDAWQGSTYLWFQMLAQHGYVVVSVDNRGAAWRGSAFRKVTQLRLGIHESDDQIAAARWIGRQTWGDSARIGIFGWSYGGYMTALTATRGGALFRAALAVAPVTDWRLYDSIYTERYMSTPELNPEGYRVSSPQSYVDGLAARLMIVHGTGDDNVHPQNTLQLANRLEEAGKLFSMMLYPNRTHSLSEGGVTPQLRETFTRFILDNL